MILVLIIGEDENVMRSARSLSGRATNIETLSRVTSGITTCFNILRPLRYASSHIFEIEYSHVTISSSQGDSVGRVRFQLMEKMLQPCGPPPEKEGDSAIS